MSAAAKSKAAQVELKLGQVEGEAAAAKEQAKARLAEEKLRAEAAEKRDAQNRELIEKLKAEKGPLSIFLIMDDLLWRRAESRSVER